MNSLSATTPRDHAELETDHPCHVPAVEEPVGQRVRLKEPRAGAQKVVGQEEVGHAQKDQGLGIPLESALLAKQGPEAGAAGPSGMELDRRRSTTLRGIGRPNSSPMARSNSSSVRTEGSGHRSAWANPSGRTWESGGSTPLFGSIGRVLASPLAWPGLTQNGSAPDLREVRPGRRRFGEVWCPASGVGGTVASIDPIRSDYRALQTFA